MPGTELAPRAIGAMRRPVLIDSRHALCAVFGSNALPRVIGLSAHYAVSGTELAYGATSYDRPPCTAPPFSPAGTVSYLPKGLLRHVRY
eukprot:56869-Rhodomonas_salina.5